MAEIKDIFRAYDIRGNTEEKLTPEVMKKIGKAFGTFIIKKGHKKVVVGHDARNTSIKLKKAFIEGLKSTKVKRIVDLGLEPFGTVLYYGWKRGFETAYITASHLPPMWNGVKFYHSDGVGYLEEENNQIRDIFIEESFEEGDEAKVLKEDIRDEYIEYVVKNVEEGDLDVLIDCGNGVAGLTAPEILDKLGFNVDVLHGKPDGDFPNRESDVNEDSISKMLDKVDEYDIGIAYDGDSDRCFIITNNGKLLRADETAYLVLDKLLEDKNGDVVANVECSRRIEDVAEKHDSNVERVRVGHTYLFKAIKENEALFGVERAGHFAVPQIFPLDDGVAASVLFASKISDFEDIEEELDDMPEYFGDRIPFKCPDSDKFEVVEKVKDKLLKEYEDTSTVDGVRVELENGWVLIRASNTSPKIRITMEAETEKDYKEIKSEFSRKLEETIEEVVGNRDER